MKSYVRINGEEYRNYTVSECFKPSSKLVRGFTQKNFKAKLHCQEFYEINVIMRGSASHCVGQHQIKVVKGDVFIISPRVFHGYDTDESVDVYHILVNPKFLEKNSAELQRLPSFSSLFKIDPLMREKTSAKLNFRLSDEELLRLSSRLDSLSLHSLGNENVNMIIANAEALAIIAELCAMYDLRDKMTSENDEEDPAFLASVARIYEGYGEKLTVAELARIARMSRNSYISKFKRIMGCAPSRFLRLHRIDVIKQMLLETSLSESEIAFAVGCCDTSHLIKMFYSETGMKPGEFKNKR